MKRINPKDDFGYEFFDVGDEDIVNLILDKLNIEDNLDVELNFQGCITNYPATSRVIDKVLFQLEKLTGDKHLIIKVSLEDDKIHLLNGLFFGSKFLDIQEDSEILSLEKMDYTIEEKITQKNIKLNIQLVNKSGKILKEYYGNSR